MPQFIISVKDAKFKMGLETFVPKGGDEIVV
jgi:hypothetical protein